MKKYRRISALILAIIMVTALVTGCGKTGNESADSTAGKTVDEDGNVVIRVAITQDNVKKQVEALIRGFQAQGNKVSFKIETIVGDYTTKLVTQVIAGTAPDIIWLSDEQVRSLASKDVLVNLQDYYEENDFDDSDIYESMLYCGQYNGDQYMMPRDYNHIVTYYNKQLFAEAGVPEPEMGWTWEEFVETAYKFTEKSGSVYTRRGCDAYLNWGATLPVIIMGLGGTITTPFPNGTEANFNTPETVKALTEIKKLVDDGVLVNNYSNDIGDFTSGKVAMTFQTRSVLTNAIQYLGEGNVGVTTFPILPKEHIVGTGTSGYGVISSSKCKEEAAKFIFYSVSEEGQLLFSETGNCVPVRKSLADNEVWRNSIEGIPAEPFLDSPEYDIVRPNLTVGTDAASIRFDGCLNNALSSLLTNIYSPEEAAEFGQSELESAFTRK